MIENISNITTTNYDLIILDLDDVVFTSKQYVCSTTWYINHYIQNKKILTPTLFMQDVLRCFNATEYEAVSPQFINNFSNKSNVFGLTTRPLSFANETTKHLASVDMYFSHLIDGEYNVDNGVIYAGLNPKTAKPNNKGKILDMLLDQGIFGTVSSILFIDDSVNNINDVKKEIGDSFDLTTFHFTDVAEKLDKEYNKSQLISLGNHQFNFVKNNTSIPTNEETCESVGICPMILD